ARLEALERIADEIESRSAMSSSASAVYDRMMSLAGARGIHIERMQPSRETVDGTQGFSLTVVGGFDGIIGLLEDIEAGAGFARTTTVRVAGAGRGALRAAIETVHYELPSRIEPVVAGVETEETP
ncbi:MAG: hypothetical protein VYC34_01880, partial [Planctomycetota bacterium]|nr:hypothetical protein [Planctomycetota bacterium]